MHVYNFERWRGDGKKRLELGGFKIKHPEIFDIA